MSQANEKKEAEAAMDLIMQTNRQHIIDKITEISDKIRNNIALKEKAKELTEDSPENFKIALDSIYFDEACATFISVLFSIFKEDKAVFLPREEYGGQNENF